MNGGKRLNMIHIHKFVTEEDVNFYRSMSNDGIKKFLDGHKEVFGFPDGDIDVLLEQFREEGFTKYCRRRDWILSTTKVFNNDGKIIGYNTWNASFRYINKWNQESAEQQYKIIVDKDNKILWLGGNQDYYFISAGNNIYGFEYEHKSIVLFPNISAEDEYFSDKNMDINDQLIRKYRKNAYTLQFVSLDRAKTVFNEQKIGANISIDEYFEKGVFYKGLKWNKSYDFMYPNDITILVSIQAKDNLFYIEIENITYPFHGYMVLDLNEIRIVEAKKII
jgi:hypothetical protein